MPTIVRLRSAVCIIGRFPALAGVDLDVEEGEVVLISGANGAGKTTLLRLLAGLVPLHSGSAEVLGTDLVQDRRRHRPLLSFMSHQTFCYDDLTVRENLRFAERASGAPPGAGDRAIEDVGLGRLADVAYHHLSAGQQRRVALAVALSRAPRLLLLDEPHAGLDSEGRGRLDEVLTSAPLQGVTVVLASHELDHARGLASREVAMTAGQAQGALLSSGQVVPVAQP